MSVVFPWSLFARVQHATHTEHFHGDALISANDPAVLHVLAGEMARLAAAEPGEGLVLIVDSHTAQWVQEVDTARAVAEQMYLFGEPPSGWRSAANLTVLPYSANVSADDRFLVLMSSGVSLAVIGYEPERSGTGSRTLSAGWTGHRLHVTEIGAVVLEGTGRSLPVFPPDSVSSAEHDLAHASQLMTILLKHMSMREHDAARDKDDLFSVLEILKAISAKRRCHDVLFVFVEQIARVINDIVRCSVVRVWGGARVGHVLASHDDERVSDLMIDLAKYPEIILSIETGSKVIISDVGRDPITQGLAEELRLAGVTSLLVIPIVRYDPNVGSLFLRATRSDRAFTSREISFSEIVAEAASNALERAYLFEGIQRANERLEYLAVTDGLTGLNNHRRFRELLEGEFERASRYGLPLSLLMFDIDDFKVINDTFGHLQGDVILREMAQRILRVTRKSDSVARYGGEEFTVIMPQTGLAGAQSQAERLLSELRLPSYPGIPEGHRVTVSIGVGVLDHETMLDCEALIRAADTALYVAKRQGKDRVVAGLSQGGAR